MQYGIKEVMDVTILDFATKKPITHIDFALASTTETTAERTSIRGGIGLPKLLEFDSQKDTVLNLTIPLVDLSLLAHIAGDSLIKDTVSEILATERVRVENGEITISKTPIGTPSVFKIEGLRDFGDEITATWIDNMAEVTGVNDGEEVFVLYQHAAPNGAKEIKVRTDSFPREVEIHGKGLARLQQDGLDYPVHMTVHKARPRADFTLTMEGETPTTLELVFDMAAVVDKDGHKTYVSYIFEGKDTP